MEEVPLLEVRVSDGWATAVVLLPDGGFLSAHVDPLVKRWSASGEFVSVFEGHQKSVDTLALLPGGRRFLSGSVDGSARLWDLESGGQLAALLGHKKTVADVAVSPDGTWAATASYDRTVRLWDIESGEVRGVLKGHSNNVVGVCVSPDGSLLASGAVGGELRLWSLPEGELVTATDAHPLAAIPAEFFASGSQLVSTGADDMLAIWSVPELAEKARYPLGSKGTHAAVLSPDGRLAAVTVDAAVRLLDLSTGAVVDEHAFGVKGVYGVSFSADGKMLATATADSFVRTWRVSA
jgi:WD40 repeat protein